MKRYALLMLLPALLVVGCNWNTTTATDKAEKVAISPVETTTFKLAPEQIASDLVDHGVTVGPFAQLWVFADNQNITVKVLQKRLADDGNVVVAVQVDAKAVTSKEQVPTESGTSVPPSGGKAPREQRPNPALPTTIHLSGIMKVVYEEIAGQWYVVGLGDVKLKLTAGK